MTSSKSSSSLARRARKNPRRRTPAVRALLLLTATLLTASCGPSYSKARVAEAVVELCQKEYQLTVQAKLEGTTLAVLLPAQDLLESPLPITPETDLQTLSEQPKFSAKGMDQLQHVALVVRRVILSTDAPMDFYIVLIRDAASGQIELRWLGHVLDLKRLNAFDISQGEFLKYRAVISFQAVPTQVALRTVRQLFEDLRRRAPIPTIGRHFSAQTDLQSLLPFLLQHLGTARTSAAGASILAETKARQISDHAVLVFARALLPTAGVPPVREEAYYFVVEVGELRGVIRRIVPVALRPAPHPTLGRWAVPVEFIRYGAPERWPEEELFVEQIHLPKFLAEQVARRIRLDVATTPHMPALAIAGDFVDAAFQFQFRLGKPAAPPSAAAPPARPEAPDPTTPQGLATVITQTTAHVVQTYGFTQFKRVRITEVDSGAAWEVSAAQLPAYRRRVVPPVPSVAS